MEEKSCANSVLTRRRPDAKALDISVVIVNWNTRELLLNCIQSILNETKSSSLEIIVVDNDSTDGSVQAVQERYPQVKAVANKDNLGFAKANNIGIRQSTGRFVCIVNSDIVALDGCLDKMREYLEQNPKIGVIGPKTITETGQLRKNCREFPSLRNTLCHALFLNRIFPNVYMFRGREMLHYDFKKPQVIEVLSGCFLMIRREALKDVGLLDETFFIYGEDFDWGKRFYSAGWNPTMYPEAKAIHIGGASSSRANIRFLLEKMKADYQYWTKHHGFLVTRLFIAITVMEYTIRSIGWAVISLFRRKNREFSRHKMKASFVQAQWHLFHIDWKKFQ